MNRNRSIEWKRADVEFEKTQIPALARKIVQERAASILDEKSTRLKAARLARDSVANNLTRNHLLEIE